MNQFPFYNFNQTTLVWIIKMKECGLVTSILDMQEFCINHSLNIMVQETSVHGEDGVPEMIPVTDTRIQECCGCENLFNVEYLQCKLCLKYMCYWCSEHGKNFICLNKKRCSQCTEGLDVNGNCDYCAVITSL